MTVLRYSPSRRGSNPVGRGSKKEWSGVNKILVGLTVVALALHRVMGIERRVVKLLLPKIWVCRPAL